MKDAIFGKDKIKQQESILEPSTMEAGETEITVKTFPHYIESSRSIVPEPGVFIV